MADANPAVPDFWRYYGNKKLSDVDITLIEEEPAAVEEPGAREEAQPASQPEAAADGAAAAEDAATAAEVPESSAATAAAAADAPTAGAAAAAVAAGESQPDNTDGTPAKAATWPDNTDGTPAAEAAGGAITVDGEPTAAAATADAGASAAVMAAASDNKGEQNEGPAAAVAEEQPAAAGSSSKRKRQQGEHIFGHSLVLAAFSSYCRTKLEDWDDATDTAEQQRSGSSGSHEAWQLRREIQLLVPAGQLELGRLLVRGMYQQQPDLSGVTQAQLIQLLLLADRFEVPKVQAAVSAAFKALPLDQLQWDTVLAVHGLPAGCAELAACQDLFSAATAKLQQELGDLELALTDPQSSKAKQLLGLPFGALKQLLQDERTRASSENTVFFAIQCWHKRQQRQIETTCSQQQQQTQQLESLRQQAQELLLLVRMPQCSQLFIASVVGQWDLAATFFSYPDLLLASQFGRSTTGQRELPVDAVDLPAFERYPAWLLPARAPSAMTQLTIDWKLPLAELKEAFEEHLESGEESYVFGDSRVWQGLTVFPRVEFITEDSGRLLGSSCVAKLVKGECRSALTCFSVKSVKLGVPDVVQEESGPNLYFNTSRIWGDDLVQLGAAGSWAAAEVVLRRKGLVGSDGCLHLSLTVSDVE